MTILLLMVVKMYVCAIRLMHAVIFGQPNNRSNNIWYYECSAPFHYTQCVIVANTLSLLTPSHPNPTPPLPLFLPLPVTIGGNPPQPPPPYPYHRAVVSEVMT